MAKYQVSLGKQTFEALEKIAASKNVTRGKFVSDLFNDCGLADPEISPIVLQVPKNIINSKNELENWLSEKTKAIVNHYHKK